MKLFYFLFISFIILVGCTTVISKTTEEIAVDDDGYKVVSQASITFKWKIVEEQLEAVVSGPTKGWLAVGFNPEKPKMDKSNFIIGYVKDGDVTIADHIAKGWSHKADEEQNVIESSGEEKDEHTTLRFTIPLKNDTNEQDVSLRAGQEIYVLLAYGNKDDLKSYHKKKTVVKLVL